MSGDRGYQISGCKWLIEIMQNQIGQPGINQKKLMRLIEKEKEEIEKLNNKQGQLVIDFRNTLTTL